MGNQQLIGSDDDDLYQSTNTTSLPSSSSSIHIKNINKKSSLSIERNQEQESKDFLRGYNSELPSNSRNRKKKNSKSSIKKSDESNKIITSISEEGGTTTEEENEDQTSMKLNHHQSFHQFKKNRSNRKNNDSTMAMASSSSSSFNEKKQFNLKNNLKLKRKKENEIQKENYWLSLSPGYLRFYNSDLFFMKKNNKFIHEIMTKFHELLNLISETMKLIEELKNNEDVSIPISEKFLVELFSEVSFFEPKQLETMNLIQTKKFQYTITFFKISKIVNICLKDDYCSPETIPEKKHFSILELVSFYYDFFWISYAIFLKLNRSNNLTLQDKETFQKYPHYIFKLLFEEDASELYRNRKEFYYRSMINQDEFLLSTLFIDLCSNLKKFFLMDENEEKILIKLAFPIKFLNGSVKHIDSSTAEKEKNNIMLGCILSMLQYPDEEIEKFGVKMMYIDSRLNDLFGKKTENVVNQVLYLNIQSLNILLSSNNHIYDEIISSWKSKYCDHIYHKKDIFNQEKRMSQHHSSDDVYLFKELISFKYDTPIKDFCDRWINRFVLSSSIIDNLVEFKIKDSDSDIQIKKNPNASRDILFNNITFILNNQFIDEEVFFRLITFLFFEIQMSTIKKYIGQLFVLKGVLIMQKQKKEKNKYKFQIYKEIRPNIMNCVIANFRFFPIFDLKLISREEKGMPKFFNYHINMEHLSNIYIIDGFNFDNIEKKIQINFNVNMKQLKQSILHNRHFSIKNHSPPKKNESIYLPYDWKNGKIVDVPIYFQNSCDANYKQCNQFEILNFRIMSFTQNNIHDHSNVILHTPIIKKITVTKKSIQDNNYASNNFLKSSISSAVIFRDSSGVNHHDDYNSNSEKKEDIANNIHKPSLLHKQYGIFKVQNDYTITKTKICINNIQTFNHDETNIRCIKSFNIQLNIEHEDFFKLIQNWMSLYQYWPISTFEKIMQHSMPSIR